MLQNKKVCHISCAKDTIPTLQKPNTIYCLIRPGCIENYIGKTDRDLVTRLHEHGSRDNQPKHQHLSKCENFKDIVNLMKLLDIDSTTSSAVKIE